MSKNLARPTRSTALALLALVLALGCGGGAAPAQQEPAPETAGSERESANESESMSLDAFSAELARQGAPELCNAEDAPLRACFQVDSEQCTRAFTIAMTECANQLRASLPAAVDASNADATATTISQCAGQAYRLGLDQHGLVRQTPECQPPAS